jgi:dihydroorotase
MIASDMVIPAIFDAHVHFRQTEEELASYIPQTARCCDRAVIMPNLDPPVTTGAYVAKYRDRILAHAPRGFRPLMTLYLTPETTPVVVEQAKAKLDDDLVGAKIYPRGATTASHGGIPFGWLADPPRSFVETLRSVAAGGLVLNVHGENPDAELLDREPSFLRTGFAGRYANETGGRVVLEHVSTRRGVDYVAARHTAGLNVACSITLHHLFLTLDDTYGQVHNCCRPAPMEGSDLRRLIEAAQAAEPWCFLGSDSAPHADEAKYRPVAACGCFTAPSLPEKLTEIFAPLDDAAAPKMAAFTSGNAGAFYGVPASGRMLRLAREDGVLRRGTLPARPWGADEPLRYRLED